MKIKSILAAALLAALLTGCYDSREIDDFANVTAVGIEPGEGKTLFTFAISDAGSFDSEGDNGSQSGIMCCSAEADNIENAINEINKTTSKLLSFSHMSIIFISDKTADVSEAVKYLDSMPDVRPQTLISVSQIPPSEYLKKVSPQLEVNMEKYFMSIFCRNESYIPVLNVGEFTDALYCKKTVLAPVISGSADGESISEEDVSVIGAAPVANGKAVGFIENTAPLGLALSTKNVKMTYGGKDYLLKSVKKPKIRIDTSTPTPSLTIDLQIEFIGIGFDDNAFISDEVKKSVSTLLAGGYDVFGFSDLASKNFLTAKSLKNCSVGEKIKNCRVKVNLEPLRRL